MTKGTHSRVGPLFVYYRLMVYDDNARRLAVKAIGTVESRLNYQAINYGDPITVGIMQWYGVRAAAILKRMKAENPSSWKNVQYSIDIELAVTPSDNPWWNDRRLTQSEGESLKPVLANNKQIQDDQAMSDLEPYKNFAVANGMDADGNTNAMIFFFSMYHQGPVYALQVLQAVGANASLEKFRDGALANPVLGQYSNRYNEVYEIIKAGDISDTTPPAEGGENGGGGGDTGGTTGAKIKYLEVVGQNILIHLETGKIQCYPTSAGRWLPERQAAIGGGGGETPPVDPGDTPGTPEPSDPTPTPGGWIHPLPGATLTSGYGYREGYDQPGLIHAGIDLSSTTAASGGKIIAPFDMEIVQAMEAGTGGFDQAGTFVKGITLSGTEYTISFFHMVPGSLNVRKGDKVKRGHLLGIEGQSGYAFGTHLHLEIWPGHKRGGFRFDSPWYYGDGTPVNPVPIFQANGVNF